MINENHKKTLSIIKKSILAGILIGLGVIINTQTAPPLGPMLFSFGLLIIINMKLKKHILILSHLSLVI